MSQPTKTVQVEVAVVGAGPAGLSAALSAARAGAQVLLIDTYRQPGGQYYRQLAAELKTSQAADHQPEGRALWQQGSLSGQSTGSSRRRRARLPPGPGHHPGDRHL